MKNKIILIVTFLMITICRNVNIKALAVNSYGEPAITKSTTDLYKYPSIQSIKDNFIQNKVTIDDIVTYTKEYINRTNPQYHYINKNTAIDPKMDMYIQSQVDRLNAISNSYQHNLLLDNRNNLYNNYPLFGVPILVKDNIDIKGVPTTNGSAYFLNNIPTQSSDVVKKIEELGGIIVGKTSLSEYSGIIYPSQTGYSEIGKQGVNVFNKNLSPSGSSSGSAIAASLNFPLTIGTETSGSIIAPASANAVYGYKPTKGLFGGNDNHVFPLSPTLDTVGALSPLNSNINYFYGLFKQNNEISKDNIEKYKSYSNHQYDPVYNYIKDQLNTKEADNKDLSLIRTNVTNLLRLEISTSFPHYINNRNNLNLQEYMTRLKTLNNYFKSLVNLQNPANPSTISQDILDSKNIIKSKVDEAFGDCDIVITDNYTMASYIGAANNPIISVPYKYNGVTNSIFIIGKINKDNEVLNTAKKVKQLIIKFK